MIIKVRLSEADRARLGCPEWLEVDPLAVSIREAITLQKGVDLDGQVLAFDTPHVWRRSLFGEPIEDGEEVGRTRDWQAEMVLVWLGLRRAGLTVTLHDLDYDPGKVEFETELGDDAPAPMESGKAESSPETTSP